MKAHTADGLWSNESDIVHTCMEGYLAFRSSKVHALDLSCHLALIVLSEVYMYEDFILWQMLLHEPILLYLIFYVEDVSLKSENLSTKAAISPDSSSFHLNHETVSFWSIFCNGILTSLQAWHCPYMQKMFWILHENVFTKSCKYAVLISFFFNKVLARNDRFLCQTLLFWCVTQKGLGLQNEL